MQTGDRVNFVEASSVVSQPNDATFYHIAGTDKLYLGSTLLSDAVDAIIPTQRAGELEVTRRSERTSYLTVPRIGSAYGVDFIESKLPTSLSSTGYPIYNWVIYGNNEPGKNLLDLGKYDTTSFGLRAFAENGQLRIVGKYTDTSAHTPFRFYTYLEAGDYILSGSPNYTNKGYAIQAGTVTDSSGAGFVALGYDRGDGLTFTLESASWIVARVYTGAAAYGIDVDFTMPIMLRKEGTSEAFEPYQIGVGEKTGNLVDVESAEATPKITVNTLQNSTGTIWGTTSGGANYINIDLYPLFEEGKTYTISFNNLYTENTMSRVTIRRKSTYQIRYSSSLTTYGEKSFSFTYTAEEFPNGAYISIILNDSTGAAGELHIENFMLVEGNTAPESFIPYGYKIPIQAKQRTKNLLEITAENTTYNGVSFIVDRNAGTVTATRVSASSSDAILAIEIPDEVKGQNLYFSGCPTEGSADTYNVYTVDYVTTVRALQWDGTTPSVTDYGTSNNNEVRYVEGHRSQIRLRVKAGYDAQNVVFKPMLRKADTNPDFEPYYNIIEKDIYIGDTPLVEGQHVSKSDTGANIPTFDGEMILDTTLYNAPSMWIVPTDAAKNIIDKLLTNSSEIQRIWQVINSLSPASSDIGSASTRIQVTNNVYTTTSASIVEN